MSINHFPPELLIIILSNERIPLKQRIALRAVTSKWLEVIEDHVFKKKTTELVLSNFKGYGTESNRLPCKDELVPLLVRLFPKLANLSVHTDFEVPYKALPGLLTAFSTTLTTLKLGLYYTKDPNPQWTIDLTTAINSLSSLTTLYLELHKTHIFPQLLPSFSRLRQLNCHFTSTFEGIPSQFWQTITANQPLPTLTTLEIAQKLTNYATTAADLVATFPSLQVLKLHLHLAEYWYLRHRNHPADIFPHLAPLQHLTELNLVIDWYFHKDEPLPLPSPTDRPLTQVKKLTLTYSDDLDNLTTILVAWFPSLEVLCLCDRDYCGFHLTSITLRNLARLEQLIELYLSVENHKCILDDADLISPQLTERPIVGLKRLHLLLGRQYPTAKSICTTALVAWFPSLEYLKLQLPFNEYLKDLTTAMLQDIGQLKSLVELELPMMRYEKKHLEPPLSFDRPLICLKELTLEISIWLFDEEYFCSTVTAWFPALEMLNITFYCPTDEDYESYKTTSETIRNGFGSSVNVSIFLEI